MKGKNKTSNNPTFFSKTLNFVKNPFFIIGLILLISIIIYFVISHKQSTPAAPSSCNPTTEILCGGICYPKSTQCVNDKPCSNQNFCQGPPGGTNSCCNGSRQWCDTSKNACDTCPTNRPICSGTGECCPTGESCTGPGNEGSCCITDNITTDGQCCSSPSTICKSTDGKTTTCCNPTDGQVCDTTQGKCVTGCPNINDMNSYKCPGDLTPPPIPTKSILCNDSSSVCTVDCDKTGDDRFVCQPQSVCNWGPVVYNPNVLLDNQSNIYQPSGKTFYQCSDSSGANWIKSKPNLNLTSNISGSPKPDDKEKCNIDMCIAKIEGEGVDIIKGGISLDGNYNCEAQINCSDTLIPANQVGQDLLNTTCNAINNSTLPPIYNTQHGRCCSAENGIYTGQVCNPNEFCDDDQKCYTGFEYIDSLGKCKPTNANNQSLKQCYSNAKGGICANVGNTCTNWKNCFCCPKYKSCNNCEYTYRMNTVKNPKLPYDFTDYLSTLNSVREWNKCGQCPADNILYIYVPKSVTFTCTKGIEYSYDSSNKLDPSTITTPDGTLFDDNTVVYKFSSGNNCLDFTFQLNGVNLDYIVHMKSGGNCTPDPSPTCYGQGWCLGIFLNNTYYGVNQNTVDTQTYLGDELNAWAQIGSDLEPGRPGRIWISAPAPKQSDGSYKYLDWPNACPTPTPTPTPNNIPNILPDTHHRKKNESKNINLFIFMIFIIIFLLVLYFFRN